MKKPLYQIRVSDIILSAIIIIAALSVYLLVYINAKNSSAKQVVVTVGSKEYARYSIDDDAQYKIKTESGYNILKIKDSKVSISDADCPDKYCAKHKSISRKGETIVCLPHKLTINISDENYNDDSENFDAVAK